MKTPILIGAIASFFGLVTVANATAILTLIPTSGALSEVAGSTVGWGFTLSNASDYAVVSSSNFCLGTSGVTSLCLVPNLGTYTDQIASNYIIVGPSPENPVVTQAFSSALSTGVGSFSINPGEPVGTTNVGQLVLTYDLYSVDPNSTTFDPTKDLVSAGNFLTAGASVTVAPNSVIMPEPASAWLITLTLGGFVLWGLKRKLSRS